MAVVKMHQASDGSLHPDFEAYAKHEEAVKIRKSLQTVALNESMFAGENDGQGLDFETIASFVVANGETLRAVLNGAVVSKRGRKAESAAA